LASARRVSPLFTRSQCRSRPNRLSHPTISLLYNSPRTDYWTYNNYIKNISRSISLPPGIRSTHMPAAMDRRVAACLAVVLMFMCVVPSVESAALPRVRNAHPK
ncbi:unnamed protein product, partial [Meganyctiphanes norvegica]